MKPHARNLKRLAAWLLVAGGAALGWWYFVYLAPAKMRFDVGHLALLSPQERWQIQQRCMKRGHWYHDDGFAAAIHGDKAFAKWIMDRTKPGDDMGCLGSRFFHSSTAMEGITNHELSHEGADWLRWWERNKLKSQAEWIVAGFEAHGIEVDFPVPAEQVATLLAIMPEDAEVRQTNYPKYFGYNAMRLLRDSGHRPLGYSRSNRTEAAKFEAQLLAYEKGLEAYPSVPGLGQLLLEGDVEGEKPYNRLPPLFTAEARVGFAATSAILVVVGFGLLLRQRR